MLSYDYLNSFSIWVTGKTVSGRNFLCGGRLTEKWHYEWLFSIDGRKWWPVEEPITFADLSIERPYKSWRKVVTKDSHELLGVWEINKEVHYH